MLKRILRIALVILTVLSICGCGDNAPTVQTGTPTTITTAPAETTPAEKNFAKNLSRADVESIPLATNDMSKAELRQLCMDFLELQLSFYWKPDTDISFQMTNYKKGTLKDLTTDTQYAGIVYHSKGFGNVYRWLEYYDEQTGVLKLSKFLEENGGLGEGAAVTDMEIDGNGNVTYQKYRSLMALGNQCSSATCWSWGRVVNSACFGDTCDLNMYNGFIPVGCYTYGYTHEGTEYGPMDIAQFGVKSHTNPLGYDTPDVIRDWNLKNGKEAMFDCYAQLKPGDCLVDEGHALMVKSVNLYKNKSGTVLYDMSTITVNEQIEAWHYQGEQDGVPFKQQGGVERSYSFKQLQNDGYIPFTFRELLDENDPQDKKHIDYYDSYSDQLSSQKNRYETFPFTEEMHGTAIEEAVNYCTYGQEQISVADFQDIVVGSNYSISDVFVTVTDKNGNVLLHNVFRAPFSNYREVSMSAQKCTWEQDEAGNYLTLCHGLEELATGENTVTVAMQISTGQVLTAYSGKLSR